MIDWSIDHKAHRAADRSASAAKSRAGIAIVSLCFVHCLLGPLLLAFAGLSSLIYLSEKFEIVFWLGSAVMGTSALLPA